MKVYDEGGFRQFSIRVETQEDADLLWAIFNYGPLCRFMGERTKINDYEMRSALAEKGATRSLFNALCKTIREGLRP